MAGNCRGRVRKDEPADGELFLFESYKLLNKKIMVNLYISLFLISALLFIIGLINPKWVPLFTKGEKTKRRSKIIYGTLSIIFFILIGTTSSSNKSSEKVNKASLITVSTSPTITTIPSPTPEDWISNPLCHNAADLTACLVDKYPLQATVKTNGFALYISNPQDIDWTNCSVNLDDNSYGMNLTDSFTIKAGSTTSVPWGRLIDGDGNRFNYQAKQPGTVDLTCVINHAMHTAQYDGF